MAKTGEAELKGGGIHSSKTWKEIQKKQPISNSMAFIFVFIHSLSQSVHQRVIQRMRTDSLQGASHSTSSEDQSSLCPHVANGLVLPACVLCTRPFKKNQIIIMF